MVARWTKGPPKSGWSGPAANPILAGVQPASPRRNNRCSWACRPFSPVGRLYLARHEQPILLRRVRNLHLDPLRDELLRMMDARYALIEILERFERTLLALLENRPHRLLAEAGQEFEHVKPGRDRLRPVEEVDELVFFLLDRLRNHERQLLLRGRRELFVSDASLHVQDLRAHVDLLADVHALPHGKAHAFLRYELEQFELVDSECVGQRLPMELRLVGMTLR